MNKLPQESIDTFCRALTPALLVEDPKLRRLVWARGLQRVVTQMAARGFSGEVIIDTAERIVETTNRHVGTDAGRA